MREAVADQRLHLLFDLERLHARGGEPWRGDMTSRSRWSLVARRFEAAAGATGDALDI